MGTVVVALAATLVWAPLHTPYAMFVRMCSFVAQQLAGMLLLGLDSTSAEVDTAVSDFAVVDAAGDTRDRLAGNRCMDKYCPCQ